MRGVLLAVLLAQAPEPAQPAGGPTGAAVSDPQTPVAVSTRLSPDPSHVGDLLTLEVIAAYPRGFSVNLPIGLDLAPFEIVGIDEGDAISSGAGLRKTFTVTLQHFDVGEARVPDFPLTWVDLEGRVETMTVPGRALTVESLLANEVDLARRPDDPPVSLEYPNETVETIVYAALVALIVGAALALAWARWRRRLRPVVLPPPVPAHVVALEALDALAQRRPQLIESGLFQDYYLELTEIAKGYVEHRFGVEALDRTTEEIRRDLLALRDRVRPLDADALIRFLQTCDLVKFARFAPPAQETVESLDEVRHMVEQTIPAAPAPKPAAESSPPAGDDADAARKEVA